jgi:hypothetical protein
MGPFRARAFGGHEDAGVEQISCEVARQKRVEDSSRQERLVVETQARPSSKRGKIKAIKSRVEEVGSSRAMRCFNAAVRRGTNGGRPKFLSTPKSPFCAKVPEDGSLPSVSQAEKACNSYWYCVQKKPAAAGERVQGMIYLYLCKNAP